MSGCRRLWSLIEGLPVEAAVWRPDTRHWSQAEELAAQQIEVIDAWSRILYQTLYSAHSGGKTPKMPPEVSIKHPGRNAAPEPKPVERNPDAIKQFFSKL